MDLKAVPQHLIGQVRQQGVVLPARPKIVQSLRPGDKGHLTHIGHRLNLTLEGPCLLLCVALVHIGQKQIVVLQIPQHVVQVHRHQGKGAHNQKAGHNHAHGGKGHKAVGEDGVEALAAVILKIKPSRHCNTRLSRR